MDSRRPIDVVFLDLDGTVVDLAIDWDRLRAEVRMGLRRHGVTYWRGVNLTLRYIARRQPRLLPVILRPLTRHEHRSLSRTRLRPGTRQLLSLLNQAKVRTYIITNNHAPAVKKLLKRLRIHQSIRGVSGRANSSQGVRWMKPNPIRLRRLVKRLRVAPHRAIMIGNELNDALIAEAVGLSALIVSSTLRSQKNYRVFRRLTDMLPYLRSRINQSKTV